MFLILLTAIIYIYGTPVTLNAKAQQDLLNMDIETLMNMEVTSVSKKSQSLLDSAAAIFVITAEDIQRSGVTTIADALKMVPGLGVFRIDCNKWAVSSRGFNSRFSDKLLVLMDGRSLYTPLYTGVYWEVQDTMIEDIDRIEVIRGPGATLWGANAVNGVINIITKHTGETLGGLVTVGGGTYERTFARARYGARLSDGVFGRLYLKGDDRDAFSFNENGGDAGDNWKTFRSGFRVDGVLASNQSFRIQGDIYQGDIEQQITLPDVNPPYAKNVADEAKVLGSNLLLSWEKTFSSKSSLTFQAYYDQSEREEVFEHEKSDVTDLELQHRFSPFDRHDLIWGLRYRYIDDQYVDNQFLSLPKGGTESHVYSLFIQDEIKLFADEELFLTMGSKLEHNDFTGVEIQPSIRLMWQPHKRHNVWLAVSRAVRTPTSLEQSGTVTSQIWPPQMPYWNPTDFPVLTGFQGRDEFDSQKVIAYEAGYRFLVSSNFSVDLAVFYNKYEDLRTFNVFDPEFKGTYLQGYAEMMNAEDGSTHGVELSMAWQPTHVLKFDAAYSWIHEDFLKFRSTYINESPSHQLSLRCSYKPADTVTLDFWIRYVDAFTCSYPMGTDLLRQYHIDSYLTGDFQISWKPANGITLSLVGQNVFDGEHMEFVQEYYTYPTEVERSYYVKVTYAF